MTMEKVRIGVIGCGGMGKGIHLPSLTSIPDCEVCAVCDLAHEKADAMAEKYGIPRT
jgi:predicted dehydrogenase